MGTLYSDRIIVLTGKWETAFDQNGTFVFEIYVNKFPRNTMNEKFSPKSLYPRKSCNIILEITSMQEFIVFVFKQQSENNNEHDLDWTNRHH